MLLPLVGALACVAPPKLTEPGASGLWGYVELVPHAGTEIPAHGAGAYADRRIAGARRVDYDKPGFAVVYLDGGTTPAASVTLRLIEGLGGLRYEPARAALPVGGVLRVENATAAARVVSVPAAGVLQVVAAGEGLELRARNAGPLELFAPGSDAAHALVFSAPGPFAVLDTHGRYELVGVAPGRHRVAVWHPRFPPTEREVELSADRVVRLDLTLGVGLEEPGASRAR